MDSEEQMLADLISKLLRCNCLRSYPPGHHWESCPAFDPVRMQGVNQVREQGQDPAYTPFFWPEQGSQ